jgi:tRNA-splicing ligase RtcB
MSTELNIFSHTIDPKAIHQMYEAMKHPSVVRGALMPDAHLGYSLPIGGVALTDGMVFPAWVGYDIGCGMCAVPTTFTKAEIKYSRHEIFSDIYKEIPVGYNHNSKAVEWDGLDKFEHSNLLKEMWVEHNAPMQLGTLGGGNHFIEIGQDLDTKVIWVIIHSGSRGFGYKTAQRYMQMASPTGKASEGNWGFEINSIEGTNYWKDLNFCLEFALENRLEMLRRIEKVLRLWSDYDGVFDWDNVINRNHNHATYAPDGSGIIHRKGATHAELGMGGVIPGNMRDGSFIVEGLGNPEGLWSSSHGAGRVLGRKKAKETLDVKDFKETMKKNDILAKVEKDTLDESPFAYKDIYEVMELQSGLVSITAQVKPLINVKG